MPLTDKQIKQAKPEAKDYWLSDEKGLRLLVKKNGSKYWRLKYRFQGKQKTLALGVYPDTSLKFARQGVTKAREALAKGIDPSQQRKQGKLQSDLNHQNSFEVIAKEWWNHQKGTWKEHHANRVWGRIRDDVLPSLGQRPIIQILPQDIIPVVRIIEDRGALDVASRVLQDIRRICRYAVQTGRLTVNPASDLTGILRARKVTHRDSLPREQLPGFLLALESYDKAGRTLTKLAIQLLILTFVRSGELRNAEWKEFDLENSLWRIPADRMKMNTDHIVPLSKQAIKILTIIKGITGRYDLVFPSERNRFQPMSDNTMRRAIFKLGYDGKTLGKSKAVPHGFRATASSILNEEGFNPDAIERQLSHQERNGVRAAYTHHARYLEERASMMQWWADYLDTLRKQIYGVEKKQLPHLLCTTNMLLHGIEVPSQIRHDNTLARPLRDWGPRDRVKVVVANPPFGGMEEDGIELNFPAATRTRETADLFLQLIIHLLETNGRAAIVLPDGTLFGEGVKTKIKEKLLAECNLHTIVRLPNSVFAPYTSIKTNILFFEKGTPTENIWYYEVPLPVGVKAFNKTKPMKLDHFSDCADWWGEGKSQQQKLERKNRQTNEKAWQVSIDEVKARNYNLDIKNPHQEQQVSHDPDELLASYEQQQSEIQQLRDQLKGILAEALAGEVS